MTDQLVTFETAKLAKEKGFDEQCSVGYVSANETHELLYYEGDGDGKLKNSEIPEQFFVYKLECAAPTQSLLQRWLRSKDVIVFVELFDYGWFEKDKPAYQFRTYNGSETEQSVSLDEYKEYELALEAALQEGLKLIP